MIKVIKAYQTTDGDIFYDELEAKKHQFYLSNKDKYDKIKLPQYSDSLFRDLVDWIVSNKAFAEEIISISKPIIKKK